MPEVAVCEGRLIAWVPGRIANPNNGSQGRTKGGQIQRSQARRAWRDRTALCCKDAMNRGKWKWGPLVQDGRVVLTAFVWNLFDEDGLAAALKPIVDGLRDARLISGDGPKSGITFVKRQVIERKHRGVEVLVQIR